MTTALILNIVLAAIVISGIVGLLAASIVSDNGKLATRRVRSARRRRSRMPVRALSVSLD